MPTLVPTRLPRNHPFTQPATHPCSRLHGLASQVLPGSDLLFEHEAALAEANTRYLPSVNMLGAFSDYCRRLEKE